MVKFLYDPWFPAMIPSVLLLCVCALRNAVIYQRSLEQAGDRLVVFMNENEQFRVNHRFCRPFLGTSQDDIMRRVSRSNKRMAKAIKARDPSRRHLCLRGMS